MAYKVPILEGYTVWYICTLTNYNPSATSEILEIKKEGQTIQSDFTSLSTISGGDIFHNLYVCINGTTLNQVKNNENIIYTYETTNRRGFWKCDFDGTVHLEVLPHIWGSIWGKFNGNTTLASVSTYQIDTLPSMASKIESLTVRNFGIETITALPSNLAELCIEYCPNFKSVNTTFPAELEVLSFQGCTALETAPNIPAGVSILEDCFQGCTALTGTVNIESTSLKSHINCFADTTKSIYLEGAAPKWIKVALAATSTNNNVYVGIPKLTIKSFDVHRRNEQMQIADDGTMVGFNLAIDYPTAGLSNYIKKITVNLDNVAAETTLYADESFHSPLELSSIQSKETVYGIITNPQIDGEPHKVAISVEDIYNKSTEIKRIISPTFIPMDISPGGKHITFGKPAYPIDEMQYPNGLLDIAMDVKYKNKSILDYIYPVHSVYETFDITFNPNTYWGGTWEKLEDGRVLIAANGNNGTKPTYKGKETDGEEAHKLTIDEMPSHTHGVLSSPSTGLSSGQYQRAGAGNNNGVRTYATGGDGEHNNMQPWTAVYRWHRTA